MHKQTGTKASLMPVLSLQQIFFYSQFLRCVHVLILRWIFRWLRRARATLAQIGEAEWSTLTLIIVQVKCYKTCLWGRVEVHWSRQEDPWWTRGVWTEDWRWLESCGRGGRQSSALCLINKSDRRLRLADGSNPLSVSPPSDWYTGYVPNSTLFHMTCFLL